MPKPNNRRITIRGRVITKRMGRIAVVCLRNDSHDEYDTDVPLSMLPKGVEDGAEVEITITLRNEK
ncbi:MAG: hypothetical protein M3348_18295 [Acidobacteriota bacterium]|nr:hypothetical protein [Acidobacteriota bacterium]